jgi:hypothetical protein
VTGKERCYIHQHDNKAGCVDKNLQLNERKFRKPLKQWARSRKFFKNQLTTHRIHAPQKAVRPSRWHPSAVYSPTCQTTCCRIYKANQTRPQTSRPTQPDQLNQPTQMTQNPQKVDFKLTIFTPIAQKASQQHLRLKPPSRPLNPVRGLKTEKRFEIVARVNIPAGTSKPIQSLSARLFTTLHT